MKNRFVLLVQGSLQKTCDAQYFICTVVKFFNILQNTVVPQGNRATGSLALPTWVSPTFCQNLGKITIFDNTLAILEKVIFKYVVIAYMDHSSKSDLRFEIVIQVVPGAFLRVSLFSVSLLIDTHLGVTFVLNFAFPM